METTSVNGFYIAGIAVRTTNEGGQAATDIPRLWQRLFEEQVAEALPGRESNAVYCLYTDYELDHTRPYTTVLGYRVAEMADVPEGYVVRRVVAGDYVLRPVCGKLEDGIVYREWLDIWDSDLPRAFTSDFEVYGEHAQGVAEATVNIFLAVK